MEPNTFGNWLRRQRKGLDLTREAFAERVGCSAATIRKLEAEERRPSAQIVERLAYICSIPPAARAAFLRFARGDWQAAPPDNFAARYIPALHLENDPAAAAQLLGLAAAGRGEPPPADTGAGLPLPRPREPGAPAGLEALPANRLPSALTPFIGREREIVEVTRLLTTSRAVTLTGAGGSGKSRLAFQVAAAVAADYRHGAFAVELAALADPALVLPAVAQAFSLSDAPSPSLLASLLEYLQPRQVLLVLDNCEHLILACAQLVETLLRACPHLRVLATSREGLRISGESTWPVPGLTLPDAGADIRLDRLAGFDALRLFMQCALAALPSFELDEHNRAAIVEICCKLDGIPLAIELAAPLVRVLTPAQIATRLDDRFRLLTGGSRTALPRHQTLRGTIDWSHELLAPAERVLFRRLAVFAGGWGLEAAEQVCAGSGIEIQDTVGLLYRLVTKSLVITDQSGSAARFQMLETIRQYAGEKLEAAGETEAANGRHLTYFLGIAEEADQNFSGRDQAFWLDRLALDTDNLRGALSWAIKREMAEAALRLAGALPVFWVHRGLWHESRRWLDAALNLKDSRGVLGRSLWRAKALGGVGLSAHQPGMLPAEIEESLSIYRELGHPQGIASALMMLSAVTPLPSQAAKAFDLLNEALQICLAAGDQAGIGRCLHRLGSTFDVLGDRASALEYYRRSVEPLRAAGDQWGLLYVRHELAWQIWLDGDGPRAIALLEEHLAAMMQMGIMATWTTLDRTSEIHKAQGRYAQAREAVLGMHQTRGMGREPGSINVRLGQIEYLQGHLAEARVYFEAAHGLFQALNDRPGLEWTPAWLGSLAYRAGDLGQARTWMEAGLALQDPDGVPGELAFSLLSLGNVSRAQGQPEAAARLYARSLKITLDHGEQPGVATYLEAFAQLAIDAGQPLRAARLLGAAEGLREKFGTPVPPVEWADREQAVAQARAQLEPAAFSAAWSAGLEMALEQAVDLARADE